MDAGGAVEWLSEHDAKELLRGAGVERGRRPARVVDEDDAVAALAELGGHIALKLSAPGDPAQVGRSARSSSACARRPRCGARSPGFPRSTAGPAASVLAERMAAPGVELIVAARADAVVPALVIGLGGIWTEVLDDVAIVPLPAGAAGSSRRSARCAAPRC